MYFESWLNRKLVNVKSNGKIEMKRRKVCNDDCITI